MAGGQTVKLLTLFLTAPFCFSSPVTIDEITVSQGRLRGTIRTTRSGRNISAFIGIPYAQPPVGPLRFRNPLPAASWDGTFVADTDGNQCPQCDATETVIGYEDCLYLNVYTVQVKPPVLYPTMVFFHGGAFVRGNGSSSYKGPEYIMDKDVVLVVLNYRLGVLGFLSTGDKEATGNFGLKDQTLALHWVQDNIEAFGGDPKRVTIFGQSAGGVSVNLHALSDSSNGLFHQYIAHSGSSLCFWGFHEISSYKKYATRLGEYLNCPTNSSKVMMDCLREIDVYRIVASNDIFDSILKRIYTWVPTNEPDIEGAFITSTPLDRMLDHKLKDYPSMSGNVADEGLVVSDQLYANSTLYDMISRNLDRHLVYMTKNLLGADEAENLVSHIKEFYFKEIDPNDKDTFIKGITNMITDTAFLFPAMTHMQVLMQLTKSPFYYFSFNYRGTISETMEATGTNDNIGVIHDDDLIYLFPKTPAQLGYPDLNLSEADEHVIDLMVDLWTSFAYSGIPTSNHTSDSHIWKQYDAQSTYLRIGDNSEPSLTSLEHFQNKRMHFWIMRLLHMVFLNIT